MMVRSFNCFSSSSAAAASESLVTSAAGNMPAAIKLRLGNRYWLREFNEVGKHTRTGCNGHPIYDCSKLQANDDNVAIAGFRTRHFPRWFKTLVIGSLGIRITPANGWSSSRIRKTAQATEKAPAIKARVLLALAGASRLKPKKMTTRHKTRAISNGFATYEIVWACTKAGSLGSCSFWRGS